MVKPKTVDLLFLVTTVSGKYLDDETVKIVIDGDQTIDAQAKRRSEHEYGQRTRVVLVPTISYGHLKRIAKAKRVRITVGPTTFDLSRANLAHIRDVIKTVD